MTALVERVRGWGTREWATAAGLIAAVVYLPSLGNGFAYDDLPIIVRDQTLHSLGGMAELLTRPYWPGEEGVEFGLWRPVTSITMALLWVVSNGGAWAYHLANLLLHAAITAGVVVLGARVFPLRIAAVAGLLFAVHPVHVEAVANGVGIAELLAAGFVLAALERATRRGGETVAPSGRAAAADGPDGASGAAHRRGRSGVWTEARDVGFLYLLAFLSKESAVVLPGLLFVLETGRDRTTLGSPLRWLRARWPVYAAMLVVAIAVLAARGQILGTVANPMPALGALLLPEIPRIHTVGEIWAEQLRLLAWPFRLSPDYAPAVVRVTTVWTATGLAALGAVLCFLIGAGLWYRTRATREGAALPLGILWYVVAISPITNLVFVAGVLVAERTLYLPSVGAAFAMAGLVAAIPRRGLRPAGLVLAAVVVAWTARSVTYQPKWKDQSTIFQHMLDAVPESGRSAWVRGDLLLEDEKPQEALAEYRRALGLLGPEYVFLTESGRRLITAGLFDPAVPFLTRAWENRPEKSVAPQLLTVVSARREDWEATEEWARRTIEANPEDIASRHLLSVSYAAREEWGEAARAREALLEVGDRSAWQQWFWLVELRGRAGELSAARAAADSARVRAPGTAQVRQIDSVLALVEALPDVSQNSGMLQDTRRNPLP